jgi:protease-4
MKRFAGFLLVLFVPACAVVRLPFSAPAGVREVTLMGEGENKILQVEVSGTLSFRKPRTFPGFPEGESLPARLRADLDRARKDPKVRGLLLRIDSPGGTVTASDVLFHEILLFREERQVPVVASIVEKGLSGGYYVALAADAIVAHPTSVVGSVGVFVPKFDASGLLNRLGVRNELTKSGIQKDLLSPLRPATVDEQAVLQSIVDTLHDRFEEMVRTARAHVSEEDLEIIATAAPFTAQRALELHMVDRLGYVQDAFRVALGLAGLSEARLVAYRTGATDHGNPYSLAKIAANFGSGPLFLDPMWIDDMLEGGVYY